MKPRIYLDVAFGKTTTVSLSNHEFWVKVILNLSMRSKLTPINAFYILISAFR